MPVRRGSGWFLRFMVFAASSGSRSQPASSIPGEPTKVPFYLHRWSSFTSLVLIGIGAWAFSAGIYPLMALSVAIWGLGFASTNSMQQVRLVAAAPPLAPASVSLNTSVLYVGQAIGSAIGGLLFGRELLHSMGFVAAAFVVLAVALVPQTRPTAIHPMARGLIAQRPENRRNDVV